MSQPKMYIIPNSVDFAFSVISDVTEEILKRSLILPIFRSLLLILDSNGAALHI